MYIRISFNLLKLTNYNIHTTVDTVIQVLLYPSAVGRSKASASVTNHL